MELPCYPVLLHAQKKELKIPLPWPPTVLCLHSTASSLPFSPLTSWDLGVRIWNRKSEIANAISWCPEGHKTELTVLLQYCAATVPDPSQFGDLVLYWGTEHIGVYSHTPQGKHRAESASMQSGRAAPPIMTPSQSIVLTISTLLQGILVLHHTELHDCHTQSLP